MGPLNLFKYSFFTLLFISSTFAQTSTASYIYKKKIDKLVVSGNSNPTPPDSSVLFELSSNVINFLPKPVGESSVQSVLVQNQSGHAIAIGEVAIQGEVFNAISSCGVLNTGETCTVAVTAQSGFKGDYSGVLTVSANGVTKSATLNAKFLKAEPQLDVQELLFGDLYTNKTQSQSFYITNTGDYKLDILGDVESNPSFSLSYSCSELAPGQACQFIVHASSTYPGSQQGSFTINTSAGSLVVAANANFVEPVLTFEPKTGSNLAFQNTNIGASSQITLQVTNTSPLALNNVSITESINDVVSNNSTCSGNLAPGSVCEVTLTWTPSSTSDLDDLVYFNSGELTANVRVSGKVNKSVATLQSGSLTRGTVGQYGLDSSTLTFKNNGNVPMTITGLSGLPSAMSITSNNCTSIPSESTCTITVSLNTATGAIQNNTTVSTVGAIVNTSITAGYSIVNTYSSCGGIYAANNTATSGVYVIDPDGSGVGLSAISVYCDMSTADGGPWMLSARILTANTDHSNVNAVGSLTSPTQSTAAKLSDVYINAFAKSHFYLKTDSGYKSFYQQGGIAFAAISTAANRPVSLTYTGTYNSYGVNSAHGGLNSYGNSSSYLLNGVVYGDAGASSACRKGLAVNGVVPWCGPGVSGTMWIK